MSNARKLQTEIDRVMKKVDEGVDLFDEIWEKVYTAEQQNQKEKYEMDLKKEIKKLQRLRDQIKTWIGSSDVKDKEPLLEARKLIETKMEQFKICEKETKTKTYSKEGLARQERLDPQEQAKRDCGDWIAIFVEQFQQMVEDREVEIEQLMVGKGKKTNKQEIEQFQQYVIQSKYHISKLEGIMRLVNNDVLDVEVVESIKEDLEYYMESFEDEDYQQAYDEEFFYEPLGLEDLDVVNVDRVTVAPAVKPKVEDDLNSKSSSKSSDKKGSKKNALATVIPLTIGRARASSGGKEEPPTVAVKAATTPSKGPRSLSTGSVGSNGPTGPTPTTIPAARAAPAPPAAGASMAAILKRETEQQEKERQKARAAEQLKLQQQQQQAAQLQRQQQEAQLRQQQEVLRLQQQQQEAAAKQKALQQQQQQAEALRQQQQQQQLAQQEALKRQQQLAQQQQQAQALKAQAAESQQKQQQQQTAPSQGSTGAAGATGLDSLSSSLGGLSLGGPLEAAPPNGTSGVIAGSSAATPGAYAGDSTGSTYLSALNESFATMPNNADNERSRQYTPQNPYPTPTSYPSTPSAIFDNPAVFEKLGTDCLFFIFYYAQGTYQQYLAARELKKQSWRFHKKYMTWFQRHEEPKVTTDEYEQGTYVYFDYETGWCTRIKTDFRFEYSFLEDSLQ